jgi:hypothetical protein
MRSSPLSTARARTAVVRPSASTARKSWRRFASADGRGEMRSPEK